MRQQLTQEEKVALAEAGLNDPVFFNQTFLAEWFPGPIPWVHRGILAIMHRKTAFLRKYGELDKIFANFTYRADPADSSSPELPIFREELDGTISMVVGRYTQIMLPRGFSKTTLANSVVVSKTCYQEFDFPFYLSESGTHASRQLATVKRALEEFEPILEVFGNLKPSRNSVKKWSESEMETTSGVKFAAKGRGGQVRGSSIGAQRPDYIIIDDVEDEESVNTHEQRQKTLKWAYEAVMPALPPLDKKASIVALGTLLHREALLQNFAMSPEWTTITFGALDKDGEPLWPEAMDKEELELKRKSFARVGNLAGYYREYFNILRDDETALFKEEYVKIEPGLMDSLVVRALAVDPAISEKKKSDFFAVACVGMTDRGQILILDVDGKVGVSPRDQVDWFFAWHNKWGLTARDRHGIEAIAYQQALVHLAREEMFRRGTYFEIDEIRHGQTAKLTRVEGVLQPRYAAGYISHARRFPLYEQQLLDWPNDKLDLPDVVSMAITLLDPHAANAAGRDLGEDEYEPLQEAIGGNFRHAP